MNDHAAGASPVDRTVRPAAEARWYCLDRDGVAMLCKDEADARAQVIESNDCWPARAPHRAVLLGDVAAERERCGRAYGSREVAMTAEIARLRERVLELETYPKDAERYRWLRDVASGGDWGLIGQTTDPTNTDARIDDCMAAYRVVSAD